MTGPASDPGAVRRRLLHNTLHGVGGRLFGLAVAFFLTSYCVGRLGTEAWALYALAGALTGYLALLDLGLGTGYVKYVAERAARGDAAGVNEVLATGFWGHLGFGAALAAGWAVGGRRAVDLLGIAPARAAEAHAAFSVAVAVLAVTGAAAAFRAVLYGFQRIDLATRAGVALVLPRVLATLFVLEAGHGLVGLVLADAAVFLLGTVVMAALAARVHPALSLDPRRCTRGMFVTLFRYGVLLQVSRLAEMVNLHFDKLLLARFAGLRSVTDYDLGSRLLSTGRSFPLLLVNAVVPAVSDLEARGEGNRIERLAARSLRYLLLAGGAIFGLIAVEAGHLVAVWLGDPGRAPSALAVRVLALGYLLNVASGAFTSVTQGIARNDYQLRVTLFALLANVTLSLALVRPFGFPGVLVATGVAMTLAYAWAEHAFRRLMRREFGGAGRFAWRAHLAPLVGVAAGAAAALALHAALGWPSGSRGWGALHLALGAAAFLPAYALGALTAGGIAAEDRALLAEAWALIRGRAAVTGDGPSARAGR